MKIPRKSQSVNTQKSSGEKWGVKRVINIKYKLTFCFFPGLPDPLSVADDCLIYAAKTLMCARTIVNANFVPVWLCCFLIRCVVLVPVCLCLYVLCVW